MKVIKWFDENFESMILLVMLLLLTVIMSVQIIARYAFGSPMTWPEEFCRYCYVWTVFLSLGYTLRKGNMLRVSVVVDLFPSLVRNLIRLCGDALLMVVFAVFFYNAVLRTNFIRGTGQLSPAMQWPIWSMYSAAVVGFGIATLRLAQACYSDVKNLHTRAITTREAVQQEAAEEAAAVLGEQQKEDR